MSRPASDTPKAPDSKRMILVAADTRPDRQLLKRPEVEESGGEFYVVVPDAKACVVHGDTAPTAAQRKEQIESALKARQSRGMLRTMGRAGRKQNEVKSILNFTQSFATTAGADNATVINIRPTGSTEFASFAALWDEMIVDSGKLDFTVTVTTDFTSSSGASRAVVAYDPLDNVALGSLSNGLQHSQHYQFGTSAAIRAIQPAAVNGHGIHTFKWKTPPAVARTVAGGSAAFGHEWSSTSDTADDYGYLKWFIPLIGNAGVVTVYYTWTLNCRFRCRT